VSRGWYTAQPHLTLSGTNIDAPDPNALADFYRGLLGWTAVVEEPGWVILSSPDGGQRLSFQEESRYVRPVWPAAPARLRPGRETPRGYSSGRSAATLVSRSRLSSGVRAASRSRR
jgi:hypothetical protein